MDMFHSPGPRLILSVCETPRLDGDKGRGRGLVTRGVFLGGGMFSVWNSFCVEFQREAVIPETGKCYKQYGNTWPLLELPPPPALLPSDAGRCQERKYTTNRVHACVHVCVRVFEITEQAQSVSGGGLIEQMWPMHLSPHSF